MELTREQEKEYYLVKMFVDRTAKTWFFEPKQCWNSATTCIIDIQAFGSNAEQSKIALCNRLFASDLCRNHIVNDWAKELKVLQDSLFRAAPNLLSEVRTQQLKDLTNEEIEQMLNESWKFAEIKP